MRTKRLALTAAIAAVGLMLGAQGAACADAVSDFYKGKHVTFVVGYNPGGGYDFFARIVAAHIGDHIPGKPSFIVKNMGGAGSRKAANHLYNDAAKDGSVMGMIGQALPVAQRLGLNKKAVKYDLSKFNWIGRVAQNIEVTTVWHTSKIKSIQDTFKHEVLVSGTSVGGTSYIFPTLLDKTAGTRLKVVTGYKGTNGAMLAMERGEVEGSHASIDTLAARKAVWLKEKKIRILVQYTRKRSPDLKDVPTIVELARPGRDRDVAAFYAASSEIGRSVMAPPGIPADRVKALRTAFMDMTADEKFRAEMKRLGGGDVDPLSGEELQKLIVEILDTPDETANLAFKYTVVPKEKKKK